MSRAMIDREIREETIRPGTIAGPGLVEIEGERRSDRQAGGQSASYNIVKRT